MSARVVGAPSRGEGPHARRWMMFVDGENFTIQGQQFALAAEPPCRPIFRGTWWELDVFLWLPQQNGTTPLTNAYHGVPVQDQSVRSYYYTSLVGDEQRLLHVREKLWELRFQPEVFKKNKQ